MNIQTNRTDSPAIKQTNKSENQYEIEDNKPAYSEEQYQISIVEAFRAAETRCNDDEMHETANGNEKNE